MASDIKYRGKLSDSHVGMASAPGETVKHLSTPPVKHGGTLQIVRMFAFITYFLGSCLSIHAIQLLGAPLYLIHRRTYYSCMAFTKQQFGLVLNTITAWFSPTVIRVSGDASVAGQLHLTPDGRLKVDFPDRIVMVANHQIYTDWIYMWYVAYCGRRHGNIFIILKESIKYIPMLGPGCMFFCFIFMARNWVKDRSRIAHRLAKLKTAHVDAHGSKTFDPMWLLIFPEGTNLSKNGRRTSAAWAEKNGLKDMKHQLLPRSTGLLFCLRELKGTVEYVYDCTMAYEGIPPGEYGQDIYSLRSIYFQGRAPTSVNLHWRRFKVSDMPLDDDKKFELWLRERWYEKDAMIEHYEQTGRLPANESSGGAMEKGGHIETEVRNASRFEFLLIAAPVAAVSLAAYALKGWLKWIDDRLL